MMEVDIVVMWPQVKKCGQPPELREVERSLPGSWARVVREEVRVSVCREAEAVGTCVSRRAGE